MNAPRLMLRYLGKRNAKSLEVAIELVEMLVPRVARPLVVSASLSHDEEGVIRRAGVRKGEEGEDIQSSSAEESSSSVIPPVDDLGRIPVECTVDCLTCRSDHYSLALVFGECKKAYQYR
jgi:hypothetical protein